MLYEPPEKCPHCGGSCRFPTTGHVNKNEETWARYLDDSNHCMIIECVDEGGGTIGYDVCCRHQEEVPKKLEGLEYLKQLITEKFNIQAPKKIIIHDNKLKFQHVLMCYYDAQTKIFYGNTYHWWMNASMQTPFWVREDQINWLLKKLDRLNNCISMKGQ